MKYILRFSNGDWSIDNVQRGSFAESRLVARLALHVCGHGLVFNTPNYLVSAILDLLHCSNYYTTSKLRTISIDGIFDRCV